MRIALLGGALGVATAPPVPPVSWVELAPGLTCPPRASLMSALEARLGTSQVRTGVAPGNAPLLRVAPHGPHGATLILERSGELLLERTIDVAASECDGLAQTLALIAEAWLPPPAESSELAPAPTGDATAAPEDTDEKSAPEARPAAPQFPAASPVKALRDAAPVRIAASSESPPARRRTHLELDAALGAVLPLDTSASATGALRVGVEAPIERWLVGLRADLETREALGSGDVSLSNTSADGYVGYTVYAGARLDVAALLGLGFDAVSARISGYTQARTQDLVELTTTPGVRARWHALDDVAFDGAADVAYTWQRDRFVDDRGDRVASAPHSRLRLVLGASWSPF